MTENTNSHPSFVVALPMYNEEPNAEKSIRAIFAVLNSINLPSAIVAINDGSRDNTLLILKKIEPEFKHLYIVDHAVNQGYGAAIKSAYQFGILNGYDYVLFMDADLTQDPCYILSFLPNMSNGIDFIKASRYIKGSQIIGVPRFRKIISSLGNTFARIAFRLPLTDYTNGFRAVKTSLAAQFNLEANRFEILVEEMWQAKYLTQSFAEVSYSLGSRTNHKDSKFQYNFSVYRRYLIYCFFSLLNIKPKLKQQLKEKQNDRNE
ncbi:MAG: glycosyltransferase family 2 protein [Chloroflexi bacterium]|nr:glycosyltransferase family 2 protein [Chloroflexota bacterium]